MKYDTLHISFDIYFKLSVNVFISVSLGVDENLWPLFQFPPWAISSSNLPLWPSPLDAEVQKGIIVLPVKSLSFTKLFTGQAAIPHHIGYPIRTVS